MTVYPSAIDSDIDIIRVDDNITEVGGEAINGCRSAIFAIENELGINPAGSASTVAARLDQSLNSNGSIKSSALTSVGLVTLPIDNAQVGTNAGILESKLSLNHSTTDLYTLISANSALINSLNTFATNTFSDLNAHITGATLLSSGDPARHVASHIDINSTPSDSRDATFTWTGLIDKDGIARSATHVASALSQINTSLITHENSTSGGHVASTITVDTSNFEEIPTTATTAQSAFDAIDDFEVFNIGQHRAKQHANAVPPIARTKAFGAPDGYRENVVPATAVETFLVHNPNTTPVDNLSIGDDLVAFNPTNTNFVFDSQFSQVKIGDVIRINYGNGVEASFPIDSIRYAPGNQWVVRLNGVNLYDSDGYAAYARIDRPAYDTKTAGVLATAPANAIPSISFPQIFPSAIVAHPNAAMALGLGFDPNQLDSTHYNLYLQLYPTGNPTDHAITLPAIDVTGDLGVSPGNYTLESVVQATNNQLRTLGYNYRFIAFEYNGEFGIMLADAINGASFSIVSGVNSSGSLITSTYTNNVVGDANDGLDALGLGNTHADVAGPAYINSFADTTSAQLPTKVIPPLKNRYYIVNGVKRDSFAATYNGTKDSNGDYYWDGYISARTVVGALTVETTYTIFADLKASGLKIGKTLVVQPTVDFSSTSYLDEDYGRFIIKDVTFPTVCVGSSPQTLITVINGVHANGSAIATTSSPTLNVKIYFSEDSVSFNQENIINNSPTILDYKRLHELYIDQNGKTFSHERARMPVQAEQSAPAPFTGGSWLNTYNWHIVDVSPKLRGYRDGTTTFNKYIRFYILTYDSTSGEYTGYIGQRSITSGAILNAGPITTGRKDVVTRFYDETYNDYIDLQFIDTASTIAAEDQVLTTTTTRFVDIEIFDTLKTNDEFLLLSTCEVNWDPISTQDKVEHVKDRREFGSIAEDDFTESAKAFISAGDRHLHQNGIIRGFAFDSINASDNREIFFKGGVALVNGVIVTANNQSVTIPDVYEEGDAKPTTVDWVICVNEYNILIPLVLTSSKSQFYATNDGVTNYYVQSVTFAELVNVRKDLVPIYIVTANISSVTISSSDLSDVRRFTESESFNSPLVLAAPDFVGNFDTFAAVKNWIDNYGTTAGTYKVTVRGTFTVSTPINLTSMTYPVIFDGDGAVINVTAGVGFIVDTNITFRNIAFNYNPTLIIYSRDDKINAENGCIQNEDTNISNIKIQNCTFTTAITTQRPPFVCFLFTGASAYLIENFEVTDCTFNVTGTPTLHQACVAIVTDTETSSNPTVLLDCTIARNLTYDTLQGIYITVKTDKDSYSQYYGAGIVCINTNITGNNIDVIGILTGSSISTLTDVATGDRTKGLTIDKNVCKFIGTVWNEISAAFTTGRTFFISAPDEYSLAPGSMTIDNNHVSWINLLSVSSISTVATQILITNNKLTAGAETYLGSFVSGGGAQTSYAISTWWNDDIVGDMELLISGNTIAMGYHDAATEEYDFGIFSTASATITHNIIRGIKTIAAPSAAGSIGIYADDDGTGTREYIITNNQIYRASNNISYYIAIGTIASRGTKVIGLCVDNYFDSPTVDGTITETINSTRPLAVVAERNVNQTETAYIMFTNGAPVISNRFGGAAAGNSYFSAYVSGTDYILRFSYQFADGSIGVGWYLQLLNILPLNVLVVDVQTNVVASAVPDTINGAQLSIIDGNGSLTTEKTAVTALAITPTNFQIPIPLSVSWRNYPSNQYFILFTELIQDTAVNISVDVYPIEITYRW